MASEIGNPVGPKTKKLNLWSNFPQKKDQPQTALKASFNKHSKTEIILAIFKNCHRIL